MFYSFLKVVLYVLAKVILRLEISGTENIPQNGPVVIASNHLSLLTRQLLALQLPEKFILWQNKSCLYQSLAPYTEH